MSALLDIDGLRALADRHGRRPAGGRPGAAVLVLGADWTGLPAPDELGSLLRRVPVAGVRLAEAVDLSGLPADVTARSIALVRECSSIGVRLSWSLSLSPDQMGMVRILDHLPPPGKVTVLGEGELPLGHWRSAGSFGLFYFRKGPDFVSVVDQRSEATNRFIVDDAVLIDVLRQGMSGCAWADVTRTPQYAAAARDLVGKGLILRVGDYCVTLPVHMRRWPVGTLLLGGTLAAAGTKKSVLTVDRQL